MLNMNNHPYHMVDFSPWPLKASFMMLFTMINTAQLFYNMNPILTLISLTLMMALPYKWWKDIIQEASFQGIHSPMVYTNMKTGMILFIASEVLFFSSFFWTFFHASLAPSMEIGMNWPPKLILEFNPMSIPLLNTLVLLMSGVSLTAAHQFILNKDHKKSLMFLTMTIIFGLYFTNLQLMEYFQASFSLTDSIFGSTFFMATGFHGMHVIVGTLMLLTSLTRLKNMNFNMNHHFGFEASAWYWHFVDVVWLFLYSFMYYWFF